MVHTRKNPTTVYFYCHVLLFFYLKKKDLRNRALGLASCLQRADSIKVSVCVYARTNGVWIGQALLLAIAPSSGCVYMVSVITKMTRQQRRCIVQGVFRLHACPPLRHKPCYFYS